MATSIDQALSDLKAALSQGGSSDVLAHLRENLPKVSAEKLKTGVLSTKCIAILAGTLAGMWLLRGQVPALIHLVTAAVCLYVSVRLIENVLDLVRDIFVKRAALAAYQAIEVEKIRKGVATDDVATGLGQVSTESKTATVSDPIETVAGLGTTSR